ncbi:hypothetical protein VP01_3066g5 [Puccinia sorghi]|uniref:Uncharacterized protein n=1 Tax=Puccinia sorghi TaxID=27349 RepID=A0A0L6V1L9_9BASI|nr:hypothetical protein VP01_3066g5 [Puccinia sorghi]
MGLSLLFSAWIFYRATGAAFNPILLPGPLAVLTPALGINTNSAQGVFIEAFNNCALILSVLFLAAEKHRATFLRGLEMIIGCTVSVYTLMKRFRYWRLNIEQDSDKGSKSPDLFFQEKVEANTDKSQGPQRILPSLGQITDILRGNPSHEDSHRAAESSSPLHQPPVPHIV